MRVRKRHFGRMCRCTQCNYPIYVTFDNVVPPVSPNDRRMFRYFDERDVPVHWQPGDLIMEVYEVRGILGHGGMGIVYQVYHRGWGIDLAVKSPLAKFLPNKAAIELFERECETWINLRPHPNSVCAYYVRRMGGIPRIFMEFVKGRSLSQRIGNQRLYNGDPDEALARILDIAIQSAWGLEHAHREGVIHQDVKPGNILLGADGLVKVTDFGVAKALRGPDTERDASEGREPQPRPAGTPIYSSPDHLLDRPLSLKTDLWSWGLSVLEMFSGGIFWHHGSEARQALDRLLRHGPHDSITPPIPLAVGDLLEKCFEHDPDQRPETMGTVAAALRNIYGEVTGHPYPREAPAGRDVTPDMLNNRAVSLLDLGKSDESESLWSRARQSEPDHLAALYNCRLYRWRSGRLTDTEFARELYTQCKAHPDDWRPMYLLARVLMEMGNNRAAVQFLERILKTSDAHREVAFALAMAQNNIKRDKGLVRKFHAHSTPITAVAISADGSRVLSGCEQGRIRIWECPEGKYGVSLEGHEAAVTSLSFSDDLRHVFSSSEDGTLRLWDATTGACMHVFSGHRGAVRAAVPDRDGRRAFSGGHDGIIKEWHLRMGQCIRNLEGHNGPLTGLALHASGTRLLSSSEDHTLKIWDIAEGICLKTFAQGDCPISAVATSADPSLALAAAGTELQVWDIEQEAVIRTVQAHVSAIQCVSLKDDGRYALSASPAGTIRIWDLFKGQCLRSLEGFAPAHISRIGNYAVSGNPAGRILVWAVNCDDVTLAAPFMICRRNNAVTE